ncbi:KxYKxGKxW signal peptide domain-containing protein [Lactococcus lactis]
MKKIRPEVTTVTSKSHFRTWKSGKSWLFATSALAIIISFPERLLTKM